MSRLRSLFRVLAGALALLIVVAVVAATAVLVLAARTPFPEALRAPQPESLELRDRHGVLIREIRRNGGTLAASVRLADVSESVVPALLAAEDARFFSHPGVDPVAVLRAACQAVWNGRLVSGASTLTQQLARNVVLRPRTARGKLEEMALALRIEKGLSKERILEEYLSRISFGPNVVGIDAASRFYFDKPASVLSLAEAATLVAIPRGPTLYDPTRGEGRVLRRRDRILERMRGRGLASEEAVLVARATPLTLRMRHLEGGATHLALALASGLLGTGGTGGRVLRTTLDADLQREVEALTSRAEGDLSRAGGSALSVLVVENRTGEVLAYVGSPSFASKEGLGANDGVLALRQPGSALKPFVYAAAMTDLGMTGATVLPDVPLTLTTEHGAYSPGNYDGRFHGPVRLRVALASSLNVPAVVVADRLGPARVLEFLHRFGFASLTEEAGHYGAALALGDGEVRLSELALAYSTLARDGLSIPLSYTRDPSREAPQGEPVLDAHVANAITDILDDDDARAASFGRGGVLALPFPVAVKTGTSKGFRDNWAAGYTREVTVAVWAGNFDGTPMIGSTGVTGAGPLFHDVMLAAMRGRIPAALVHHEGDVEVEVCALSGQRAGEHCSHRVHEWFRPGTMPEGTCAFHDGLRVDPTNGLLAGPACTDAVTRVFETYPARYQAWAKVSGRPVPPESSSPRCPVAPSRVERSSSPRVEFPYDGARFVVSDGAHEIVLAGRPPAGARRVSFILDGKDIGTVAAPYELPWRLAAGEHRVEIDSQGLRSPSVAFAVVD